MMQIHKELVKCAKALREWCRLPFCDDCPFYNKGYCPFNNLTVPSEWDFLERLEDEDR